VYTNSATEDRKTGGRKKKKNRGSYADVLLFPGGRQGKNTSRKTILRCGTISWGVAIRQRRGANRTTMLAHRAYNVHRGWVPRPEGTGDSGPTATKVPQEIPSIERKTLSSRHGGEKSGQGSRDAQASIGPLHPDLMRCEGTLGFFFVGVLTGDDHFCNLLVTLTTTSRVIN